MGLDFGYLQGQTPLDEDEKEGLRIPSISTRAELDEFEQQNIEQAMQWTLKRRFKSEELLTETFVRTIHRRMYGQVWAWAGEFRKTNKNIGVDKWLIPSSLKYLLDDTAFWIVNQTYPPDELVIRFKHRLVNVHCFPNGNERHSRLMGDILIEKVFARPVFTWGASNLVQSGNARTAYLTAIWAADAGDIGPLLAFART
jgi:Fic-DOC domain mobile mystery protein B